MKLSIQMNPKASQGDQIRSIDMKKEKLSLSLRKMKEKLFHLLQTP